MAESTDGMAVFVFASSILYSCRFCIRLIRACLYSRRFCIHLIRAGNVSVVPLIVVVSVRS